MSVSRAISPVRDANACSPRLEVAFVRLRFCDAFRS